MPLTSLATALVALILTPDALPRADLATTDPAPILRADHHKWYGDDDDDDDDGRRGDDDDDDDDDDDTDDA